SQPMPARDRNEKVPKIVAILAISTLAAIFVGVTGWWIADSSARSDAVNRIVDCLHSRGDTAATTDLVNLEIDDAMEQTDKRSLNSLMMTAMFTAKNSSPELGACNTEANNLISEVKKP